MTANGSMIAAVLYGKEDVKIERVPIPKIADDEVLIKIGVALTCGTDLKVFRRGYHARMITPPALFGHELAGEIVEVGRGVKEFRSGMKVVAANSAPCGQCFFCKRGQENLCDDLLFNNGAYAEYIRIPARLVERNLLAVPAGVSLTAAAMVEPLACVLLGVNETGIRAGDSVVIIGAGPIGLMFVQAVKAKGARVISLVKREAQAKTATRFGADEVLDISVVSDPVTAVRELTAGHGADAVIEAVGRPEPWQQALEMVRKGGAINFFGGCAKGTKVEFDTNRIHYSALRMLASFHHTPRTVRESLALIVEGKIRSLDYVTGEAPLSELVNVLKGMAERNGEIKTAIFPGR